MSWNGAATSPVRRIFRHQLGSYPSRSRGRGTAAGARRTIWDGARKRRNRASVRRGEGSFSAWYYEHRFRSRRAPIRPSLSKAAASSCRIHNKFRGTPPAEAQRRTSCSGLEATAGRTRRQIPPARRSHRDGAAGISPARPGKPASFRRLHRLLEAQTLPDRLLAGGCRGDQLPPLLQHQRFRRLAHGAAAAV